MSTKRSIRQVAKMMAGAMALTSLAGGDTLHAEEWPTVLVLDYQYPGGGASGGSVVADASGNVFTGGNGSDAAGITRGMVLGTDTTQAIWLLLGDDSNPDPSQFESFVWDLGFDSNGNLYSVGQLTPISAFQPTWYVRKWDAASGLWSTVDNYAYGDGKSMYPNGFAADDAGNIYVVGSGREAQKRKQPGNLHWLVRKSGDGGQTWRLVDDVAGPTSNFGTAGAGFVPGAGIFVVGYTYNSTWLIRRSVNGEPGTWSTVDGPFPGSAQAVGSDSVGNVYVVGTQAITTTSTVMVHNKPVTTTSTDWVWITRMSSVNGEPGTWSTVDSFRYASNKGTYARGIGRDRDGHVVVVGSGFDGQGDAQGQLHWLVRTTVEGKWTTVNDFQLASGWHSSAAGVVTDADGNLLVSGGCSDAAGAHWIVLKLAAP